MIVGEKDKSIIIPPWNEGRCSTQESEHAAWVIFRDESLDCKLRYAILVNALGFVDFNTMVLNHSFRPYQIEIGNPHLICGIEAFYKLQER